MGPFRSSHRHGPPVFGRVQGATLFPDVIARMQPSDSLPPSATTPVPLAVAYLAADASSVPHEADGTCARQRAVRRRRVTGSPPHRNVCEERRGPPRLRGHPLRPCCGRNTPPDTTPHLAHRSQGSIVAFAYSSTLDIRKAEVSGPQSHGPHVRLPTHRRWHCGHRRKAGYRLGRAHPWPGGFCTRWTTNNISWRTCVLQSQLTRRAWSH
jgi:hypothetical protein